MARNVFRVGELPQKENKVIIKPPYEVKVVQEELTQEKQQLHLVEEYEGPTVEDLKKEADEFRQQFELEKDQMQVVAREEADIVFEQTQLKADQLLLKAQEDARIIVEAAESKAKKILADGRKKIKDEKSESKKELNDMIEEATCKGRDEGFQKGFEKGESEVDRLISKLHTIVGGVVSKRKEILEDSEAEVIELVLQISSRVIKVLAESQKEIVIENVHAALSKVKSRTDIIIRVNMKDLEITTEKMKLFQKKIEKIKNITILEDATIEKGGAIIETDFGHIDARISSQLREIENRIRELAPIKSVVEA